MTKRFDVRLVCQRADCTLKIDGHDMVSCRADEFQERKDGAYTERNRLVAYLASLFPSSLERHPEDDREWEDDWRWIIYMDLPHGQASIRK